MSYKKNAHVRQIIEKAIGLAKEFGGGTTLRGDNKYISLILNLGDEVNEDSLPITTESYLIKDLKNKIQYEIYGYRTTDKNFLCVEILKIQGGKPKYTSIRNHELETQLGSMLIHEIMNLLNSET